jgi:histidinol dehydrogenase
VSEAIERLLPTLPRETIIRASLAGRGALIHTRSMQEACAMSNRIAPEHLEVSSAHPERWEPLLKHAGAIFLGRFTSESLGDYCAGPNHVLPTAGTARFSSPLGVYDFVKRSSLIEVSAQGAQTLGGIASVLAHGEGLQAHARAAEMRLGVAGDAAPATSGFEVRPVRSEDVIPLVKLSVAEDQAKFVAPNAVSLAQAAYKPPGRPLGLYASGEPVGFLLLWDARRDPEEPADQLHIWRLMVDARQQRKGYGEAAVRWVIEEARRIGVASVGLSHVPDNPVGVFYERLGFIYTGKINEGEREMMLQLKETA